MWYAIIADDYPDSLQKRLAARPAHLARLQALEAESRLLLAGPFPATDHQDAGAAGFTGSLIVAAFDTLADAKRWAEADPFVTAGVYANINVKPFKQTLPAT